MSEVAWVQSIVAQFQGACAGFGQDGATVEVVAARRLPYLYEVLQYSDDDVPKAKQSGYQTDLLIYDRFVDGSWVPRIVIECKRGAITTHDALTYSAKAATHKNVHPYLRYGVLIGNWGSHPLPGRLIRHGAHFDFMTTWRSDSPDEREWSRMFALLNDELFASRYLGKLLTNKAFKRKEPLSLLHRKLVIQ